MEALAVAILGLIGDAWALYQKNKDNADQTAAAAVARVNAARAALAAAEADSDALAKEGADALAGK